jgi:hypothetical protein
MRISDARYSRDLRRYQLAWRFIQHGARTRTIERWTGLSMYRLRTLYEAYAAGVASRERLRGVAPHQVSYFWRSAQLRSEAAVLAGFLAAYGVFPDEPERGAAGSLESVGRGERLWRAYEEFKACWPEAQSTLEHAILLLNELVRGVEVALSRCLDCEVLIVIDRLAIAPPRCAFCLHELHNGRAYEERPSSATDGTTNRAPDAGGIQGSLF